MIISILYSSNEQGLGTYSAAVCESSDFWEEKLWLRAGALVRLLEASVRLDSGTGGGSMMARLISMLLEIVESRRR